MKLFVLWLFGLPLLLMLLGLLITWPDDSGNWPDDDDDPPSPWRGPFA